MRNFLFAFSAVLVSLAVEFAFRKSPTWEEFILYQTLYGMFVALLAFIVGLTLKSKSPTNAKDKRIAHLERVQREQFEANLALSKKLKEAKEWAAAVSEPPPMPRPSIYFGLPTFKRMNRIYYLLRHKDPSLYYKVDNTVRGHSLDTQVGLAEQMILKSRPDLYDLLIQGKMR